MKCQGCGCDLQAIAEYCVRCWDRVHGPCPDCTKMTAAGQRLRRNGLGGPPLDCERCGNRRYVRLEGLAPRGAADAS